MARLLAVRREKGERRRERGIGNPGYTTNVTPLSREEIINSKKLMTKR